MSEKNRGFLVDVVLYIIAFALAWIPFSRIENLFTATAVFTATATFVLFLASVVLSDVSVYDPYWSVAPPVMVLADVLKYRLYNINSLILLIVISVWSIRLTWNWYETYLGIGKEDWRYAMYRKKLPPAVFQIVSFFGLHFMPTIVVYLGLVGTLFSIQKTGFAPLCLIGAAVSLGAVLLEYVADQSIHRFIREHKGERKTCDVSVWKYSRHPNYLGEMSFWTGLYLYFVAVCPESWVYGLCFLAVIVLFLTVSIPMMEKHNLERRPDYADYQKRTSKILLLPPKQ